MALTNMSSGTCTTPACYDFAKVLQSAMHPESDELDPCKNWDQYVCGGFREKTSVPPGFNRFNSFQSTAVRIKNTIQEIMSGSYANMSITVSNTTNLTTEEHKNADKKNFDLMKTYYETCVADEKIPDHADAALRRFFQSIFPFIATDRHLPTKVQAELQADYKMSKEFREWEIQTIEDGLIRMSKFGLNAFVDIIPTISMLDHTKMTVVIQPRMQMGMPVMRNFADKAVRRRYTAAVKTFFTRTSGGAFLRPGKPDFDELAKAVVDFEEKIGKSLPSKTDLRHTDGRVEQITVTPGMKELYDLPLPQVIRSHFKTNSTGNITAEVMFPGHVETISHYVGALSYNVRLAYMQWTAWLQTEPLWDVPWKGEWLQNLKDITGRTDEFTPEQSCVSRVMRHFGHIVDSFYTRKEISSSKVDNAKDILHKIQNEFVEMLENTPYLKETKQTLVKKAKNIQSTVGYMSLNPNVKDPISVAAKYKGISIHHKKNISVDYGFMDDYFVVEKWHVARQWKSLFDSSLDDAAGSHATTVNAFYSPWSNHVSFPAGILQIASFNEELPSVTQYGGFGTIAGHELTHAFDDRWRNYDGNNKLIESWSSKEKKKLEGATDCFKTSYEELRVPATEGRNLVLNLNLIVEEAVADSVGMDVAYAAWKKTHTDKSPIMLPRMGNITAEQLFWIVRTAEWCSVDKLESIEGQTFDEHLPGPIRTWKPVMLSKGWYEAFNCPKQPMCNMFGPASGK